MKIRAAYLALFILFAIPGFAQQSTGNTYYTQPDSALSKPVVDKKVHFGMELGTGFSTNFNGASSLSTFVSPYLSYRVSPRWTFNAGATLVNGNMGGFYPVYGDGRSVMYAAPQQSTFVFAQGQFQATDRLRISGTSFYELSRFNQSLSGNGREMNFNTKGMSVFAEYKVSENFSFGVGAHYSNGNTPYYNRGFGASNFGRPGMSPYWGW